MSALQAALHGEQAAVYAFGVVGGQAGTAHRAAARSALAQHALQRDLLAARLSAARQRVDPAAAAYALPFEVDGGASARALAAHVESGLAAAYADLVGACDPARRSEAAGWLATSVLRAGTWGADPVPFPGLPERADAT
ncbi:hypothetical protein GCM10025868_07830 [Angustibacter aerolatus]|uniref:DUF4439 domain-containing protein n=1 Tax=Angustibacter aerolatus TaxID=1162965 RepID=A0ABQ6JDP6_9ACTN|nr:hypothetical protein GCM10025868_07830 [Angustibacter aerolatus]